jgi:hypothetical protein
MNRPLPKAISIGGHTIPIERQKGLLDQADAYGIFDGVELTITIDTSLNDSTAWETLWHEVVEAINFFSEADLEHKSVQVFGLLLHQTINSVFEEDNKKKKKATPRRKKKK